MEFEWDPNKAEINLQKHGISFEAATIVFLTGYYEAVSTKVVVINHVLMQFYAPL